VSPAWGFWGLIANRYSKFRVLLSGENSGRACRRVFGLFLSDKLAATLLDEDFPRGNAYTRSILLPGCAERAEAFLMWQLYADCASLDACT